MVKYTGRDGKEYVLRFDMAAMEEMKEIFAGGYTEAMQKMSGGEMSQVKEVFRILAKSGEEYLAEKEGRTPAEVDVSGLLSRHSSPGRVKGVMKAIEEAIRDGNRMQTKDEEDDQVRDGYLEEFRKMELENGKN
jgi:hypothetical protein